MQNRRSRKTPYCTTPGCRRAAFVGKEGRAGQRCDSAWAARQLPLPTLCPGRACGLVRSAGRAASCGARDVRPRVERGTRRPHFGAGSSECSAPAHTPAAAPPSRLPPLCAMPLAGAKRAAAAPSGPQPKRPRAPGRNGHARVRSASGPRPFLLDYIARPAPGPPSCPNVIIEHCRAVEQCCRSVDTVVSNCVDCV
eukprot:gene15531-biopygen3692